ncbi:MAG: GNAT family N-acetyltransferase [Gammaproteobacteria bacterium]|nr:GNAT family N-acetyltransferase [Gammaproteobacteria bacterium]
MGNSELTISAAAVTDLASIQGCARAAYARYIPRMPQEPAPMHADFASQIALGQVLVARLSADFAGYAVFYDQGDHVHLENVAVLPEMLGRGIGRALIFRVEAIALERNLPAVELYTNVAMTENLSLYPALGYSEFDRRREQGFDRVYFRKLLRQQG